MNFCFVSLQVGSKGLLKWTNLIAELVLAGFTKVQFRTHSLVELFGAITSLFTIVKDKNESSNILNNDLLLISNRLTIGICFLTQILVNQPFKKAISNSSD